jgi:hypothetical protein
MCVHPLSLIKKSNPPPSEWPSHAQNAKNHFPFHRRLENTQHKSPKKVKFECTRFISYPQGRKYTLSMGFPALVLAGVCAHVLVDSKRKKKETIISSTRFPSFFFCSFFHLCVPLVLCACKEDWTIVGGWL